MRIASSEEGPAGGHPPGPIYLDSSALIKLYLPEPESGALESILLGRRDLCVSDLAVTEIASATTRRLREGALGKEAPLRIHAAVLRHLHEGVYRRLDLVPETHRKAERLLLARSDLGLRAADALHLALAATTGVGTIATYDRRLRAAAHAIAIGTFPATSPG